MEGKTIYVLFWLQIAFISPLSVRIRFYWDSDFPRKGGRMPCFMR